MKSLTTFRRIAATMLSLLACVSLARAQTTLDYEIAIRQGQALIESGHPDLALASGEAAVKSHPERWDGYALSGRALLGLMRYEPAADAFSKAIELAPATQQPALRELRRQCLLAESGTPVPAPVASASAPAAPAAPPPPSAAPSRAARDRGYVSEEAWVEPSTGLIWARPWYYPHGSAGPWSYADAQSFCSALPMLGYNDWRLPSVEELQRVFLVSSKGWRWSVPKFEPAFGATEALRHGSWAPQSFSVEGDSFQGNRLLLWTSTPGSKAGQHAALYFGRRYSISDDLKVGASLGSAARNPFQGYALCVRGP